MTKREFIKNNRDRLDNYIRGKLGDPDKKISGKERDKWLVDDEGLYKWATRSGVKLKDKKK